jgi:hypothetical protein
MRLQLSRSCAFPSAFAIAMLGVAKLTALLPGHNRLLLWLWSVAIVIAGLTVANLLPLVGRLRRGRSSRGSAAFQGVAAALLCWPLVPLVGTATVRTIGGTPLSWAILGFVGYSFALGVAVSLGGGMASLFVGHSARRWALSGALVATGLSVFFHGDSWLHPLSSVIR